MCRKRRITMAEELTEEEREALESGMCRGGMKALRLLDAHAADRLARVAELTEERDHWKQQRDLERLRERGAELERARDASAGFDCLPGSPGYCDGCSVCEQPAAPADELAALRAEVDMQRRRADHHQGAAEALRADRAALVARVEAAERKAESWERGHDHAWELKVAAASEVARLRAQLEVAERNEAWLRKDRDTQVSNARADRAAAESEVARLREALEAEKREANAAFCLEVQLRQAAEARVRELEREVAALDAAHRRMLDERNEWQDTAAAYLDEGRTRWEAAERQLAAANALLWEADRNPRILHGWPDYARRIRAHLSAQPTAPDYQAAIDQEHRLACEWKARYEAECVEHAVTRDRLAKAGGV